MLEFDNVLDRQRKAIYGTRYKALTGSFDEVEQVLKELAGESAEALQVISKKEAEFGREEFLGAARTLMLQTLDMLWVEHLESMEYLRGSVNLRAYGQRDPLTEYRKEGTRIYKDMEFMFAARVFEILDNLTKNAVQPTVSVVPAQNALGMHAQGEAGSASAFADVGRNDKVKITNGTETREMKFKKAEPLLKQGWSIVKE